jgi:hypothetical protein
MNGYTSILKSEYERIQASHYALVYIGGVTSELPTSKKNMEIQLKLIRQKLDETLKPRTEVANA